MSDFRSFRSVLVPGCTVGTLVILQFVMPACKRPPHEPWMDLPATQKDAGKASLDGSTNDAGAPKPTVNLPIPTDETLPERNDLSPRMLHFLEAIGQDNAELARDVLYPREGYLLNRDAKDPGRTWEQTVQKPFAKTIHHLHQHTPNVARAEFGSFELGENVERTEPKSKEWRTAVWRSHRSAFIFFIEGKPHRLEIAEMTSYKGSWYITKLK